jgi:hypothetical protein
MPRLIRAVVAELETPRPERPFGSGWLSGAGALLASLTSLVAAICLHWPSLLMTPELRVVTDSSWFRPALLLVLALAYAFSFISLILRDNKLLPFTALAIAVIAALMGGPEASANAQVETPVYFGLDFFVLNVLFTGFLFVPVERLLPHRKSQTLFRQEWREDMFYFLVSSLFVQVMAFLTLEPSKVVNAVTHFEIFKQAVGSQPLILQIVEIMILTDFVQYWVTACSTKFPFSGAFMPFITAPRAWIGWRARACISSRLSRCAPPRRFRCLRWGSACRRFRPIFLSSTSTPRSFTPTSARI